MSKFDLRALKVGGTTPSCVKVDFAAALMGPSHWKVRQWITAGVLPARNLPSGGLRIAVTDLEDRRASAARPQRQLPSRPGRMTT